MGMRIEFPKRNTRFSSPVSDGAPCVIKLYREPRTGRPLLNISLSIEFAEENELSYLAVSKIYNHGIYFYPCDTGYKINKAKTPYYVRRTIAPNEEKILKKYFSIDNPAELEPYDGGSFKGWRILPKEERDKPEPFEVPEPPKQKEETGSFKGLVSLKPMSADHIKDPKCIILLNLIDKKGYVTFEDVKEKGWREKDFNSTVLRLSTSYCYSLAVLPFITDSGWDCAYTTIDREKLIEETKKWRQQQLNL